jgi:diguanylate cyclase (GGDEF)-like protein/PAS domain S-box-containing protein
VPVSAVRRTGGEDDVTARPPLARSVLLFAVCLVSSLALSQLTQGLLRDSRLYTSVWWPLAGVGVAVLARLPRRERWVASAGLGIGLLPTHLSGSYPVLTALGLVVANIGESVLIAALLRQRFPHGVALDSPTRAVGFTVCATVGVTVGATVFTASHLGLGDGGLISLWTGYFRSHVLGLLLVSPLFLVSSDGRGLGAQLRDRRHNLEWGAQFVAVGLVTTAVFEIDQTVVPTFVCAAPLVWGGLRLGPVRAMGSLMLMAVIATTGSLRGGGPIVQDGAEAQTMAIQIVVGSATVCVLFIVLAAAEKSALLRGSRLREQDLAAAERLSGLGSALWDPGTGETRWSEGMYAQLGLPPEVPPSAETYLEAIHPDDRWVMKTTLARVPDAGAPPTMEYRLQRPDGSERIMVNRSRGELGPDGRVLRLRAIVMDVTETRRAEAALQQAHDELTSVLDAVQDVAIVRVDPRTLLITFFSKGAEMMLGWRSEQVVGVHGPTLYLAATDLERMMAEAGVDDPRMALMATGEQIVRTGQGTQRWRCVRKGGKEFEAQISLTGIIGPDGEVESFVAVIVDLTPVLRAEAELQESEDRFRLSFDLAPTAMAIVALDGDPGRIVRANPALCRFTGGSEEDLIGRLLSDLMTPAHAEAAATDLAELLASGQDAATAERAFHRPDGGELWGRLSTAVVRPGDGRAPYLITMIEDITARMQLTERLRHEASHDPLTGLPNRQVLRCRLEDALTDGAAAGAVAVLYVDLDGFKGVNDGLGHAVGDELLVKVAERISACVRLSDVVARLGGDEFAVLLPRVDDLPTARAIGERIVAELAEPFAIDDVRCRIGASIGIALSTPEDADQGSAMAPVLLNAADEAMYEAKRSGKGRVEVSSR